MRACIRPALLAVLSIFFLLQTANAFTDSEVRALEAGASGLKTPGERIAFFAEAFVGTPYDPDPLGAYVTRGAIVADDRVDCMYHVFRSTELGLSNTPEEALNEALYLRFIHKGEVGAGGEVLNYGDRFQYGEDMLRSGKWGRDITSSLGKTVKINGSRGLFKYVRVLPGAGVRAALAGFRSGDIVYFVKDPARRTAGEIVGHIGILKVEGDKVWLIHASGLKRKGGMVRKVSFAEYVTRMPFAGILVGRFD